LSTDTREKSRSVSKKATLIHELGHRLEAELFHQGEPLAGRHCDSGAAACPNQPGSPVKRLPGEDEHKYLFLWIYDVWVKLYGREFADALVAVEKQRGRMYPAAWDFAMSFTAEERAAKWKELLVLKDQH
jgi:hypothetical protein